MHEMQTIVTDVRGVCLPVCHAANSASLCGGHSVQPLPNHYSLLFFWAHPVQASTTVFRSLHGLAPPYLSDYLYRLVDIPLRRRLRSASSLQLDVPRPDRRTIGNRAFAAAGPTLWNSLLHDITDYVTDIILPETENLYVFYIISMTNFSF